MAPVARHRTRPTRSSSRRAAARSCLALLPAGFVVPRPVSSPRGGLLPHPCTLACADGRLAPAARHRRSALCDTFRRLATPGVSPAPCPVEPGLSSSRAAFRGRPATPSPTPDPRTPAADQVPDRGPRPSPAPASRAPCRGCPVYSAACILLDPRSRLRASRGATKRGTRAGKRGLHWSRFPPPGERRVAAWETAAPEAPTRTGRMRPLPDRRRLATERPGRSA